MVKYAELKPLKQTKRLNTISIFTFDIETKDGLKGKEIYCWSFCKNQQGNNFKVDSSLNIKDFIDYLRETKTKNQKIIFSHNLTFDIRFILDYCIHKDIKCNLIFSGSSVIIAIIEEFKVKFLDSMQFLKESQQNAEKTYKVPQIYTKIDCSDLFIKEYELWSNKDKERILAHNKNDVIALNIIMQNFRKNMFDISNVDILTINTPSSLAMKSFRKTLQKSIINPFIVLRYDNKSKKYFYDIQKEKEIFARASYRGGRTECLNQNEILTSYYADVVSMYPFVMKNNNYPDGIPFWDSNHDSIMNYMKNGKLCIVECLVETSNLNIPILPYKDEKMNKLLFPNGKFKGVYCSPELEYAIEMGYKIKCLRALIYPDKCKPFSRHVDKFIKVKNNSKGGMRAGNKLLLNGLYGKHGQKFNRENTKSEFFVDQNLALEVFNEFVDNDVKAILKTNEHYSEVRYKEISQSIRTFMNVSFASFVTSYARLKLVKKIHYEENHNNKVYYCDTDSIVVKNRPKNLKHELGLWCIEKSFIKFKAFCPKVYIFKALNEKTNIEELNLKMKGLNRIKKKEILQNSNNFQDIIDKIKDVEIVNEEMYLKIKESLIRNDCVLSSEIKKKTFSLKNDKRLMNKDLTSIPVIINN